MSQFIEFYFTSSMLNMFRILIYPSSGACDFSVVSPIGCVFCKDGGCGISVNYIISSGECLVCRV